MGRLAGGQAAAYRLQTRVRKYVTNPKTFPTFTLPRYVDLVLATADASPLQLGQAGDALPQVAHHILQCPECAEAYEALLEIERSSR